MLIKNGGMMRYLIKIIMIAAIICCVNSAVHADTQTNSLAYYDKQASNGTLHLTRTSTFFSTSEADRSEKITLAFVQDGRYRIVSETPHLGSNPDATTEVYDNKNDYLIASNDSSVVLLPHSAMTPIQRIIGLYAGPCLILGRGLSTLTNLTLKTSPSTVSIVGKAPDGTIISGTLDRDHQLLPKTLTRTDASHHIIGRWTYAYPLVKAVGGILIPSACQYEGFNSSGRSLGVDTWKITSADFTVPDQTQFTSPRSRSVQ